MTKSVLWLFILAGLVALGACSSTSAPTTDTIPESTPKPTETSIPPTVEPTATSSTPKELPHTSTTALLGVEPNTTYKMDMATFESLAFEESELPAAPGAVTAQWYTSAGRYVVAYVGLGLSETGPLCPGNSILTGAGFSNVSNAPTEEGACEGFPTLTTDPEVGPIVCQGSLLYVTAIPSDQQGMLFGTLEALTGDGAIIGLTSSVQSSPDIPEINLEELCGS
ncbi:MAG: hypothetical protein ACNYZI_03115 [Anaerolineales bacterium]